MTRFTGDRERGAALIETAVVGTLMFVLLLGVLELGYLMRDYQITSDAVSDGARVGALLGPDAAEDGTSPEYQIMRALRDATGSMPAEWIERIVVFKGTPPTGSGGLSPEAQVPAACKAGAAVPGRCNVYNDPYDAFLAVEEGDSTYFDCPGSSDACTWAASARKNGPRVSDIEYVGVWVRVQRPHLSKLFGAVLTIDQAAVTRIEVGTLTG